MSTENKLYALNLAEDGRVLSVTFDKYAPADHPRIDFLPDGDVTNYLFVDGEFIYDPLPEPEVVEPEPEPEYATYDELAAAIREGVNSYGQ